MTKETIQKAIIKMRENKILLKSFLCGEISADKLVKNGIKLSKIDE